MGAIEQGTERHSLSATTTVGRDAHCQLILRERAVSSIHASILWRNSEWQVRDLGSTNGTFVNGRRLPAGNSRALKPGDKLAFGEKSHRWVLVDDGPPMLAAIRSGDGALRLAVDGILALPDEASALCVVVEQSPGVWVLTPGEQPVLDQQTLTVGGDTWSLRVPAVVLNTVPLGNTDWSADDIELEFAVSSDEEQVQITIRHRNDVQVLASKAEFYLLLTLARERIADAGAGVGDEDAGWLEISDLCDALRISECHLNIQVHRARAHLSSLSVLGPGGILSRSRAGQIRIATGKLTVRVQ